MVQVLITEILLISRFEMEGRAQLVIEECWLCPGTPHLIRNVLLGHARLNKTSDGVERKLAGTCQH